MFIKKKEHVKTIYRLRAIINFLLQTQEKGTDDIQIVINGFAERKIGGRKALSLIQDSIQMDAEAIKDFMKANPVE